MLFAVEHYSVPEYGELKGLNESSRILPDNLTEPVVCVCTWASELSRPHLEGIAYDLRCVDYYI